MISRCSGQRAPLSVLLQVDVGESELPESEGKPDLEPVFEEKKPDYSRCDPGTTNHLKCWHPEDEGFWNNFGKKIAKRNLWVSAVNNGMMFVLWTVPSRRARKAITVTTEQARKQV